MPDLKAYSASDGDDRSAIVFAKNGAEARRKAAGEMDCEFQEVESCRRLAGYDQFAPGPVPTQTLLEDGWWFECHHCYGRVSDGGEREDGTPLDPVYVGQEVYCNEACRAAEAKYREDTKRIEAELIAAATATVNSRYPGAEIGGHHVFADVTSGERGPRWSVGIYFGFPGSEHGPAHFRDGGDKGEEMYVPAGDHPAWEKYVAGLKQPI
jgi:hypothetical protein